MNKGHDELVSVDNESVRLDTGKDVSFQVFQDVYNEITGKKEKLSKNIKINHVTKKEDMIQLNEKIKQIL